MDNKRKASAATGADPEELDSPAAKRRKLPADFDLFRGETPESTTAYGLSFLEQIRRTADKSKRPVAAYFEKLLPKAGNEDYYRKTRMPISLETIERKLNHGEFTNLTELEAYFKRMVANAKEYYSKNSVVFEDAERIRKALSNYMTKTNPAYKLVSGFSCQPTSIPPELEADEENEEAESPRNGVGTGAEHEDGEDEDAEDGEEAEGDEDDGEDEDDDDDDEDEEDDEDSDAGVRARAQKRRSRGTGRPIGRHPKNRSRRASHTPSRYSISGSRPEQSYIGVPYKGLNFQEAQEKIVEELINKTDDDDEWAYFEPFLNLPPRTLKDYFSIITEPLSLKGLMKLVRGIHGRHESTGVSDFKGWAAFEEKAGLLWTNAHFYNEEGSEIYNLATELKESFEEELAAAKAAVQEPPQPKIKLKKPQTQEAVAPPSGTKKITIHVATRGSSTGSPAPTPTVVSTNAASVNGAAPATQQNIPSAGASGPGVNSEQIDQARNSSASGASPSPSLAVKPEMVPKANGIGPSPLGTPNGIPGSVPNGQPNVAAIAQPAVPAGPVIPLYDTKYRPPGKGVNDALIQSLVMRTHPALVNDSRKFKFELRAHPTEAQQSVTINVPAAHWKMQLIPRVLASLEQQQRMYRLFVVVNGQTLTRVTPIPIADDPIPGSVPFFEANLVPGVNWISVHLIVALPKSERQPDGPDCELEKMFIVANLLKH